MDRLLGGGKFLRRDGFGVHAKALVLVILTEGSHFPIITVVRLHAFCIGFANSWFGWIRCNVIHSMRHGVINSTVHLIFGDVCSPINRNESDVNSRGVVTLLELAQ